MSDAINIPDFIASVHGQLAEIRSLLATRLPEQRCEGMVSTEEAMRIMGYKAKWRFIAAARKANVFIVELRPNKFAWNPAELDLWKKRKGTGVQRAGNNFRSV